MLEHERSVRPADIAVVYILMSFLRDLKELITGIGGGNLSVSSVLLLVELCLEGALVAQESQGKKDILLDSHDDLTPEQLSGILGRLFFWWVNPILMKGRRKVLNGIDLPDVDHKLRARRLRRSALRAWSKRCMI